MVHFKCSACSKKLVPQNDNIYTTSCGHLYHYFCLNEKMNCIKCQSTRYTYFPVHIEVEEDDTQTSRLADVKISELTKEVSLLREIISKIPENYFDPAINGPAKTGDSSCSNKICKEQLEMEIAAREFTLNENQRLIEENRQLRQNLHEFKRIIQEMTEASSTKSTADPKVIEVVFSDETPLDRSILEQIANIEMQIKNMNNRIDRLKETLDTCKDDKLKINKLVLENEKLEKSRSKLQKKYEGLVEESRCLLKTNAANLKKIKDFKREKGTGNFNVNQVNQILREENQKLEAKLQNSVIQSRSLQSKVTEYENLMIELYDQVLTK